MSTCPNIPEYHLRDLYNQQYEAKRYCPLSLIYHIRDFIEWYFETLIKPTGKVKSEFIEGIGLPYVSIQKFLSKPIDANLSKANWIRLTDWVYTTYYNTVISKKGE